MIDKGVDLARRTEQVIALSPLSTAVSLGGLYLGGTWLAFVEAALFPTVRVAAPIGLVAMWLATGWVAGTLVSCAWTAPLAAVGAAVSVAAAGPIIGLPASVLLAHPSAIAAASALASVLIGQRHRLRRPQRRVIGAIASVAMLVVATATPAGAWISSARATNPTPAALASGGIDLGVDTHEWFADQALRVLAGDGATGLVAFFDSVDLTAPGATPVEVSVDGPLTYRWRLLRGARDADGVLYRSVRDHFHNYWTHRGRQWMLGGSAASNAELAFRRATGLWADGQRGESIYWLGAAVHLLDDACVPQHQFFALNPYHHQYELWVQRHQTDLAVDRGGIYRDQFRVEDGHGGDAWTSAHPRGWVDECAHRAARNLQAATHPNGPKDSQPSDPRWRTAPHIADAQRLTAGFIQLFFDQVGAP